MANHSSTEINDEILYSRVMKRTKAFIIGEQKRGGHKSLASYLNKHFGEKKRKQRASKSK